MTMPGAGPIEKKERRFMESSSRGRLPGGG